MTPHSCQTVPERATNCHSCDVVSISSSDVKSPLRKSESHSRPVSQSMAFVDGCGVIVHVPDEITNPSLL